MTVTRKIDRVHRVGQRTFSLAFESLIDVDWTGEQRLFPRLATAFRHVDDRTVELTLREGVRFLNGDLMTAEDVVFSFGDERMWSGSLPTSKGMF